MMGNVINIKPLYESYLRGEVLWGSNVSFGRKSYQAKHRRLKKFGGVCLGGLRELIDVVDLKG